MPKEPSTRVPASIPPGEDLVERRAIVWVVDDSSLQREHAERALASEYDVVLYASGLAMLEDLSSKQEPDVLVLDWHMPDMSGVDVCRFVRSRKDPAQLPILMLTAVGTNDSLLEALAAGANDFVKIPFAEAELCARLAALVRIATLHARLTSAEGRLRVEAEFRERFMAMLAHDLRQPLNAMFMANQVLSHPEAAPAQAPRVLALQMRAAERMKRMISELLDFTRNRPESGMPIQRQLTDWEAIVRASLEEIRPSHLEHSIELRIEGSCVGRWDPDRLSQICSNLIGNAIENSPSGSRVDVELVARDGHTELHVSNPGVVIPKDQLPTLFQPFRRGAEGRRWTNGVGLGLHIVDQIVRAHGGLIAVRSEAGTTRFSVKLPCESSAA